MRRPVPPLSTALPYKPLEVDRLEEELGGFSCANTEGCRIQNCFTDKEHIISANPAQGAESLTQVELIMRTHEDFVVPAICRWKHQRINVTWSRSELNDDYLIGWGLANPGNLSRADQKKLKQIRRAQSGSPSNLDR